MLARVALVVPVAVIVLAAMALVPLPAVPLAGCGRALEPSNRPVDTCVASCNAKVSRQCSDDECRRGCEFILDRLLEKEGPNVIACVARTNRRCTDVVWADCAARIGVHADGGPPAPSPPTEED